MTSSTGANCACLASLFISRVYCRARNGRGQEVIIPDMRVADEDCKQPRMILFCLPLCRIHVANMSL
jgi:hypothetical protein